MYSHRFKSRSVFLIGFGIGFLLALVLLFVSDVFNYAYWKTPSHSHSTDRSALLQWFISDPKGKQEEIIFQVWESSNSSYAKWLDNKKLKLNETDMDAYLYGPESEKKLEADWLKSQIHVTCVIFVKKIKLARSIRDTWGMHCNRIYFFGQAKVKDAEVPIINFEIKLVSSWQLLCEAFNYIWRDNKDLQWLIFVKDDTLVIPENLRYMLTPLNHTKDHYLGHAVILWGQTYNIADAGYVISIGALKKLIKKFDNSKKCVTGGKYWKQEDYYLAKHLASMGIHPSDTRDQYLRATFHGYPLQSLLWGVVKTSDYWTRAVYPIKNECCSFMSITFNVGEPDKMYTLNYLLYHFHVMRKKAIFGSRKASTSIPEEDVWKIALQEEFNITHLSTITSEAYYEIWHSRYSEPEQLISKNYRISNMDKL